MNSDYFIFLDSSCECSLAIMDLMQCKEEIHVY